MRVAITGASGFIGSNLCQALRLLGHEVVAVVRATSRLDRLGGANRFEIATADVRDQQSLTAAFQGVDAVVHCAALVEPYANPWEARSVNFIAAFNVCHAAVASSVGHVVQMSSSAVYARDNPAGRPLAENGRIIKDPPVYDTYSINKAAAERVVLDFGGGGSVRATVLRPGVVYGTGDRLSGPIAAAIRARRMAIVGGRSLHLPLIHIEDLLSATAAALEHPPERARIYNLDGPGPTTFASYIEGLAGALGLDMALRTIPLPLVRLAAWSSETWWNIRKQEGAAPLNRFNVERLAADLVLDTSRAREELCWTPEVGLQEGVASVAAWLSSQPFASPALPILP